MFVNSRGLMPLPFFMISAALLSISSSICFRYISFFSDSTSAKSASLSSGTGGLQVPSIVLVFSSPSSSFFHLYRLTLLTPCLSATAAAALSLVHSSITASFFCSLENCSIAPRLIRIFRSPGTSLSIHPASVSRVGYPIALTVLLIQRPCSR